MRTIIYLPMWRFAFFLLGFFEFTAAQDVSVVEAHGKLKVNGNKIVDENDNNVQLRGMSLYWSQWQGEFYNQSTVNWLVENWKCTWVRAAMAIEEGGYTENQGEEKDKVFRVIDAAIEAGIYVIVDWHDHHADNKRELAREFFREVAQRYGHYPNIIYELWNEPLNIHDWSQVIKPYHEYVIQGIREIDGDNLIICGTSVWSQAVDKAADDPIENFENVAYTLHYYAGTHGEDLMDKARYALDKDIAIVVTEWGTSEASGGGYFGENESHDWWDFLDENHISWANWSLSRVEETSAALVPNAGTEGGWQDNDLSRSGRLVRNELLDKYQEPILTVQKGKLQINLSGEKYNWSGINASVFGEVYDINGKKSLILSTDRKSSRLKLIREHSAF